MKNIFRKNQVIITSLAIMIAVAGYLNFTGDKIPESTPVNQNEVLDTDEFVDLDEYSAILEQGLNTENNEAKLNSEENDQYISELVEDIGDAGYYEDEDSAKADTTMETTEEGAEDSADKNEESIPGEAVLTGGSNVINFAASAKLSREQARAKSKEVLIEIINNANVGETQKQEAINGLVNLTAIAEKETATETLLAAKGYTGSVVSIIDDSVDVVINKEELNKADIAKIEDIVKRKTGASIENIYISSINNN